MLQKLLQIITKKHGEYWHNIDTCCTVYVTYDLELGIVHQSKVPWLHEAMFQELPRAWSFRLQGEIYGGMQQVHLFAPGFVLQSDITTSATESKKEFLKYVIMMYFWWWLYL